MRYVTALPIVATIALAACVTPRETSPPRTATEQLLISTAADRAAERLTIKLPKGSRVFVDSSYLEGVDAKYAMGAIREQVLKNGGQLAAERAGADVVLEIRSGALSMDERKVLLGIPELDIPVPLSGEFTLPEIALFSKKVRQGVAKFAAAGYGVKDGKAVGASGPQFGSAHETNWRVLLFFGWKTTDLVRDNPPELKDQPASLSPTGSSSAAPTPGWR